MNYILLQKQEPIFTITKSLYQYPNIKAQTSDEIQPLENYENHHLLNNKVFCLIKLSKKIPTELRYVERSVFMKKVRKSKSMEF